jgi:uncharacterized protein (DUF924 family)
MRWFPNGRQLDAEIRLRFTGVVEAALRGELEAWTGLEGGKLALVLVLDQLARHLYRDDGRAFAGAARAERLALELLDDASLTYEAQMFASIPLSHSEDLALQEQGVAAAEALAARAAGGPLAMIGAIGREQAGKHRDVVARFGRFPHRNAILGRASTPEETAFLHDWASFEPPRAMLP